jgi:AraC-like DNA-binding protein
MPVIEGVQVGPAARLSSLVAFYSGYRYEGMRPGTHLGLPSPYLTIVLSLGAPTRTAMPGEPAADFAALAGGLHTRAVSVEHDGDQYGIQLSLTPEGARSLLGMPAAELVSQVVPLDRLLGADADAIIARLAETDGWPARFAVLDEVLSRRAGRLAGPSPELQRAWRLLGERGGLVRIADLAGEVGWSRRHLGQRFAAEYGLTPKEAARVVRFSRSARLLKRPDRPALADAAAACGFYDQAHLAREWNDLAGCPPSAWLTGAEIPFIQGDQT